MPAGTRLGPYEIVASIGAGGMGEVYRARDPRIGRDVALKILPRAFAENEDRLRPADPAGVMNIQPVVLAADRVSYAYGFRRFMSELHVVTGLL